MANSTYNPSQPNGQGINPGPTPTAQPQKASTRLNGQSAEVTQGGPLPFTQPPVRKGNPAGLPGAPFRLSGNGKG